MTRPSLRTWLAPSIALGLAVVAGCDQPGGTPRAQTRAPGLVGMDLDTSVESVPPVAPAQPSTPAPTPPAEPKPPSILGQKTDDIGDSEKARQAGATPAPKLISRDPVRLYGNAYVSIITTASQGQIDQALGLYHADNDGQYPKTHEEFMEKIIKANNIRLPVLPRNRKYVYDVPSHKLEVWEYPEAQN